MKIAIYGAGQAGKFLFDEIEKNTEKIEVCVFIDNYAKGKYKECIIEDAKTFFSKDRDIDAIFIAAGAQKTLRTMINQCRENGIEEIYMLHDIAGKCRLNLFENGELMPTRVRLLRFSDEKPSLHYFEVPVTDNCNLNCKGCLFASNTTKGQQHVPFEELESDAKRMAELFYDVPWIRILGGEPLMHPDINKLLKCYRECFPDSEIDLCTNGLLIPKMGDEFWKCVEENRISIHVSGYKPTYNMLDKIDAILSEHGLPYAILKREEFLKYYTKAPDNDMQESFEKCIASGCYEVYRGRLSSCSGVIAFEKFNEIFGTDYKIIENEDWIDIHNTSLTAWEIKDKLETASFVCKYCDVSKMESFEWDYTKELTIDDYVVE